MDSSVNNQTPPPKRDPKPARLSMLIFLRELQISVGALDLLLVELEDEEKMG
jgi:hypothetical protein